MSDDIFLGNLARAAALNRIIFATPPTSPPTSRDPAAGRKRIGQIIRLKNALIRLDDELLAMKATQRTMPSTAGRDDVNSLVARIGRLRAELYNLEI